MCYIEWFYLVGVVVVIWWLLRFLFFKVGIVGWIGVGKLLLMVVLFRFVELEGIVCIDVVLIKDILLCDLRSNLFIIF